ncbi:Argininosuccinate lyase [Hydrogenophaga sp. T4]|nr:Argininosuccinate lyase [Hydrogenophaga sp. T4]
MKFLTVLTLALLGMCSQVAAQSPAFPNRPIVLVNPYAAGGPADLLGRALGKALAEQLGQPVVVENKPGGGASIGAMHVAKSNPDGHTLLLGTAAAHTVTPLATKVPYDGIHDFEFVGMVANVPNLLTVHPSSPVSTLKELVALAKAQPGKLSYASAGLGSSPHVGAELFKYRTGIFMTHIPYRGAAPAANDLVAGYVPVGMLNVSGVLPFVKAGRLKAIAIAGSSRSLLLPDVPTFSEAGLPNFVAGSWYSLAVPAKTPPAVVEILAKALAAVQAQPEFQSIVAAQSAEILKLNRAETRKFVQDDAKAVAELVKATGLKLND